MLVYYNLYFISREIFFFQLYSTLNNKKWRALGLNQANKLTAIGQQNVQFPFDIRDIVYFNKVPEPMTRESETLPISHSCHRPDFC